MTLNRTLKVLIPVLLLVQSLLSFLFKKGEGLLVMSYLVDGVLTRVTELYSSGSDDNVALEIGIYLYVFAAVWFMFRVNKRFAITDMAVISITFVLQLFFLVLIEAGSIFDTIYYGEDYLLASWIANLLIILTVFIKVILIERKGTYKDTPR